MSRGHVSLLGIILSSTSTRRTTSTVPGYQTIYITVRPTDQNKQQQRAPRVSMHNNTMYSERLVIAPKRHGAVALVLPAILKPVHSDCNSHLGVVRVQREQRKRDARLRGLRQNRTPFAQDTPPEQRGVGRDAGEKEREHDQNLATSQRC